MDALLSKKWSTITRNDKSDKYLFSNSTEADILHFRITRNKYGVPIAFHKEPNKFVENFIKILIIVKVMNKKLKFSLEFSCIFNYRSEL